MKSSFYITLLIVAYMIINYFVGIKHQSGVFDQKQDLSNGNEIRQKNYRGKKVVPIKISFKREGTFVRVNLLFKKSFKKVKCTVVGLNDLVCRSDVEQENFDVNPNDTRSFVCEAIAPQPGQKFSVYIHGLSNGRRFGKGAVYTFGDNPSQKSKKSKAVHRDGYNRPIRVFKGE